MGTTPAPFPPTRTDLRSALQEAGLQGPHLEAALADTAAGREERRVARFRECAFDEVRRVRRLGPRAHLAPGAGHALAVAVLVLEAFGPAELNKGPTADTARRHHRAFRAHCGARIGGAAGATHAACRAALVELWRTASDEPPAAELPTVEVSANAGRVIISAAPMPPAVLCVEDNEEVAQPPAWLLALALEGWHRALGHPPRYQLAGERRPGPHERVASPHVLDLVHLTGSAIEWDIIRRASVDRMLRPME